MQHIWYFEHGRDRVELFSVLKAIINLTIHMKNIALKPWFPKLEHDLFYNLLYNDDTLIFVDNEC